MSRPERAQSGLYNAVVFGRMVTFALQNLRSVVPDFDDWYAPKQDQMRSDEMMKFFYELRTEIEKKVDRHTTTSTEIRSFNLATDLSRFQPAPPGATAFFIGDQNGGSGWELQRPDGTIDKYYIDLPPDIGQVNIYLSKVPARHAHLTAVELVREYLAQLERLIAEAKQRFRA